MEPSPNQHQRSAHEARIAAVVIAATVVIWLAVQWLGARLGWQVRFVFLADLAAIAAFIWALVVTWRIWQRQKSARKGS
ncbi:DUF5337 family protein [Phaeovulum sp.]|uniref:DUF5337 family protein n=1 Tax=Phaeovulum sp. TaxID=2934796 RepID=UPI0039E216F3